MKTNLQGDLLKFFDDQKTCDVIAHCCNCQGVMGSGIALQIKREFPDAYQAYKSYEQDRGLTLGTISWCHFPITHKFIVNLHAQNLYGKPGDTARFVDYEALYSTLTQTRELMQTADVRRIGFPRLMAADRAGGDWNVVEAMIDSVFPSDGDIDVFIVEYNPEK